MKKKKLVKTLITLVVLGFLAKFLSMLARILMTRIIGVEGMGLFSLASPAMLLVITLAQLGLPTAVATKVAKDPSQSKKIFISGLSISIVVSLFLMGIVIFTTPFLAVNVLKNDQLTLTIYGLALLIPLVSLSALIKGFFIGQNEMKLTSFSTVMEEVGRIFFVLLFLDKFAARGAQYAAFGAMIGVCVGELFQSLYLIFFNERRLYRRINELMSLKNLQGMDKTKEILRVSLPLTLSRLIGSITYFFEPIIMTNLLIKMAMTSEQITYSYGILSGYVMPLILMPGFFATAFANFLLPNMSRLIGHKQYKEAKHTFLKVLLSSSVIGLIMSSIFFFFGRQVMQILYNNTEGYRYVQLLAFPFVIYYMEAPITSAMHALELTNKAFRSTTISCIIRLILLVVLLPRYKVFAVALSTLFSVFYIVFNNLYVVLKTFAANDKKSVCLGQSQ